jgi:hypothetical protein
MNPSLNKPLNKDELECVDHAIEFAEYMPAVPGAAISLTPFTRDSVANLCGVARRDSSYYDDSHDYYLWGQLNDGRWFSLAAEPGCDTGWYVVPPDCRITLAESRADIIRFGMTDEQRERFGLKLESGQ